MKIVLLTFLILLWSHNISAKEWSEREKQIYTAHSVLILTDVMQSRSAMKDPCECFREGNPVWGNDISDGEIFLSAAVSFWVMHNMIENDAPEWLLWTVTGSRATVVINNHMVGARINYAF